MKKELTLFEMFSGIGAPYESLKTLGYKVKHLGSIEWFIDAIVGWQILHHPPKTCKIKITPEIQQSLYDSHLSHNSKSPCLNKYWNSKKIQALYPYLKHHLESEYSGTDIRKYQILPKNIDILTYSFPCQDISTQGKHLGFAKNSRSGLLFEVGRILSINKDRLPKTLLMENVAALTHKKFEKHMKKWINTLKKLGYESSFKIVNSSECGSPQNRKRSILLSWKKELNFEWNLIYPEVMNETQIKDCLVNPGKPDKKFSDRDRTDFKKGATTKSRLLNYTNFNSEAFIYHSHGKGPTLTAGGANSRLKIYIPEIKGIRCLNAVECLRYMGFSKENLLENSPLIKERRKIFLAGNSIPVELLNVVFESFIPRLFEMGSDLEK